MRTLFLALLFCCVSLGLVDGVVHEVETSPQRLSLSPTFSDTSSLSNEARAQELSELLADKLIAESLAFDTTSVFRRTLLSLPKESNEIITPDVRMTGKMASTEVAGLSPQCNRVMHTFAASLFKKKDCFRPPPS